MESSPLRQRPRSDGHHLTWRVPLVAAAALLLAIGGYREIGFRAEQARTARSLAALQRALLARDGDVADLRAALAAAEQSAAIVQQPGLSLVTLHPTADGPPATGHVLLSPSTGGALFVAFGLPPLAADEVYALWWITASRGPVRAAILRPDGQGVKRVDATLPADGGALRAAAVTVEQDPGVAAPEGPMVLLGNAS